MKILNKFFALFFIASIGVNSFSAANNINYGQLGSTLSLALAEGILYSELFSKFSIEGKFNDPYASDLVKTAISDIVVGKGIADVFTKIFQDIQKHYTSTDTLAQDNNLKLFETFFKLFSKSWKNFFDIKKLIVNVKNLSEGITKKALLLVSVNGALKFGIGKGLAAIPGSLVDKNKSYAHTKEIATKVGCIGLNIFVLNPLVDLATITIACSLDDDTENQEEIIRCATENGKTAAGTFGIITDFTSYITGR